MLNPLCRPLALYCPASQRISVSSPTRHALAQIKVGTGQFRREQLGLWHQPSTDKEFSVICWLCSFVMLTNQECSNELIERPRIMRGLSSPESDGANFATLLPALISQVYRAPQSMNMDSLSTCVK